LAWTVHEELSGFTGQRDDLIEAAKLFCLGRPNQCNPWIQSYENWQKIGGFYGLALMVPKLFPYALTAA
jgi:hypothetical protein